MIPTLFFYELVLVAVVGLFLTLYWLWPNDSTAGCQPSPPSKHPSAAPRRKLPVLLRSCHSPLLLKPVFCAIDPQYPKSRGCFNDEGDETFCWISEGV